MGLVLFYSHKDVVSGKTLFFWQYFGFSRGKLGPKMDQIHQLWVRPVSVKTLNFERLFRDCLCLMRDYLWSKFQQTGAIFVGERAQKPTKRGHFMDAASPRKHLKIYNLTATNATLMKLTTIMYLHKTFNLAKDWGVTHRA